MLNKFAVVCVFLIKTKVYVNVYGFPTKKEAEAYRRKVDKEIKQNPSEHRKVIALRVRTIIDDEYLENLNAERAR